MTPLPEFNFPHTLANIPFVLPATPPSTLNRVLDRHPEIRAALFKAIDEDRAQGD
jgi:hypothetical protein